MKSTSLGDRKGNDKMTERHRSEGKYKDMKSEAQDDKFIARQTNKETESYENWETGNMEWF